ncbi:hypothetical protein F5887DRAFT_921316 [Amanita rubescens]|nr:hypothetical protein F5887DRAFT_921316 [Amanita rubescens]
MSARRGATPPIAVIPVIRSIALTPKGGGEVGKIGGASRVIKGLIRLNEYGCAVSRSWVEKKKKAEKKKSLTRVRQRDGRSMCGGVGSVRTRWRMARRVREVKGRLWTLSSGTRYRGGALQDGAGGWLRCQPMATDKDAGRELQAGGNSAGQLGWDVAGSSESASVDSSREWRCACRKGGMQRIGARWDPIAAWQAVDDVVRRLDGSDESWQWVATALCMLASWGADAACLAVTSRRMRAGMS